MRLAGYLNRASSLNAWKHRIDEEFVREPGWLTRVRKTNGAARLPDVRFSAGDT